MSRIIYPTHPHPLTPTHTHPHPPTPTTPTHTHPHPPTPTHTHPHPPTPTHTHPHPPTPTHTHPHPPTPTHIHGTCTCRLELMPALLYNYVQCLYGGFIRCHHFTYIITGSYHNYHTH